MKTDFRYRSFIPLTLIAIVGLMVYSNTFNVPFAFDDIPNIVDNPVIRDIKNVPSFFAGVRGEWASRPLLHATNAINYLFGGLDTCGYHAVNLLLHILNGALLYCLVLLTGRNIDIGEKDARLAAVIASLLFVSHPIQTETVTNIINRSMLLSTFFFLSGLVLFSRAARSGRSRRAYAACLVVVSLLGAASREDFIMFPVVVLLYDLFFISKFRIRSVANNYMLHIAVFAAVPYMLFLSFNNTYDRLGLHFTGPGIPHIDYALTQLNVQWTYLRLLALPVNQNLVPDYPVASGLFDHPTIVSFVGYLGLWVAAIASARRRPVSSFFVLWFLISLLPISFGVTLMQLKLGTVLLEHRAYLPSVGVLAAFAFGVTALASRVGRPARETISAAVILLVVVFSVASHARNGVWKSEITLWEDVTRKSPSMATMHTNLGFAYYKAGLYEKATDQYLAALDLWPNDAYAHYHLGLIYLTSGRYSDAVIHYRDALRIKQDYPQAHLGAGLALAYTGQYDEAIEHYNAALKLKPDFAEVHYALGLAYVGQGNRESAMREFRAALAIAPGFEDARRQLDSLSAPGDASPPN